MVLGTQVLMGPWSVTGPYMPGTPCQPHSGRHQYNHGHGQGPRVSSCSTALRRPPHCHDPKRPPCPPSACSDPRGFPTCTLAPVRWEKALGLRSFHSWDEFCRLGRVHWTHPAGGVPMGSMLHKSRLTAGCRGRRLLGGIGQLQCCRLSSAYPRPPHKPPLAGPQVSVPTCWVLEITSPEQGAQRWAPSRPLAVCAVLAVAGEQEHAGRRWSPPLPSPTPGAAVQLPRHGSRSPVHHRSLHRPFRQAHHVWAHPRHL